MKTVLWGSNMLGLGRAKHYLLQKMEIRAFCRKGKNILLGKHCEVRLSQFMECGNSVVIGENSKLLCYNRVSDVERPILRIGSDFHATRRFTIQCANSVIIGDNVLVASDVAIIDYNHGLDPRTTNYLDNPLESKGGVRIGNGVWIGNNCVILQNVSIGEKSIIGAGSVVTKDIPPYCIAAGNPAKVIKEYDHIANKWVTR